MRSASTHGKADILVVDDNHDNLRLLNSLLSAQGYQVRPVYDGQKALSAAEAKPPDLILLDILMPDINGYVVCERLKAHERLRDIPIIFISALDETFDKVKAFSVGGVDYITKPFQSEEVLARVHTHLQLQQMRKTLEAEVRERTRAQEALSRLNRKLFMMNRMSHRLQICQDEQASYQVLVQACQHIFPTSSGDLFMLDTERTLLRTVDSWGDPPADCDTLSLYDLDLVFPEKGNIVEHPDIGQISSRIGFSTDHEALCAPIGYPDEIMAALTFYFDSSLSEDARQEWQGIVNGEWIVIQELIQHYALELVNLRLRDTLKRESIHDPLTELYNRRHMEEALVRESRRAQRSHTSIGIMMLDIDHFKHFNDRYGHKTGDVILQALGRLLLRNIRGGDIACRYGGEEFLLILPDTSHEASTKRAEELLEQIRALRVPHQERTFQFTVSIGVASFPAHGEHVQDVIHQADEALYQAKTHGRNQVASAGSAS